MLKKICEKKTRIHEKWKNTRFSKKYDNSKNSHFQKTRNHILWETHKSKNMRIPYFFKTHIFLKIWDFGRKWISTGYIPYYNFKDPTIGHGSLSKNYLWAGHNQGDLDDKKVGQRWAHKGGNIRLKRVDGKLKFIFEEEHDSSTISVEAEDYNLDADELYPLINLYWLKTKIIVKIL